MVDCSVYKGNKLKKLLSDLSNLEPNFASCTIKKGKKKYKLEVIGESKTDKSMIFVYLDDIKNMLSNFGNMCTIDIKKNEVKLIYTNKKHELVKEIILKF